MNDTYCNNCGKPGHIYNQCKIPITSFGVIAFRYNTQNEIEFLMIRRRNTLGYNDFMRGKYLVQNKYYILNMLKQMTIEEKELLKEGNFDKLWKKIWNKGPIPNKYRGEESTSRDKYLALYSGISNRRGFISSELSSARTSGENWSRDQSSDEFYTLNSLIEESNKYEIWEEPEWGFPKGRRNYQEKDYDCAVREFCEETGYNASQLTLVQNILPFEEIFTGSNYKSYKHKYYLMNMNYIDSITPVKYDGFEVSKMEWKTIDDCLKSIREYNLEKKRMIINIHKCLTKYKIHYS
jgi:8-oxo-dGTP pyrophosphatase MutT (NUDIX family)